MTAEIWKKEKSKDPPHRRPIQTTRSWTTDRLTAGHVTGAHERGCQTMTSGTPLLACRRLVVASGLAWSGRFPRGADTPIG
jgi:hypothetical protein